MDETTRTLRETLERFCRLHMDAIVLVETSHALEVKRQDMRRRISQANHDRVDDRFPYQRPSIEGGLFRSPPSKSNRSSYTPKSPSICDTIPDMDEPIRLDDVESYEGSIVFTDIDKTDSPFKSTFLLCSYSLFSSLI